MIRDRKEQRPQEHTSRPDRVCVTEQKESTAEGLKDPSSEGKVNGQQQRVCDVKTGTSEHWDREKVSATASIGGKVLQKEEEMTSGGVEPVTFRTTVRPLTNCTVLSRRSPGDFAAFVHLVNSKYTAR